MQISVIIPTLNEETGIEKTISSLLNQNPPPHEVIVVDGGSKDSTIRILSRFSQVKILHTSSMISLQNNFGAAEANGDLLLFLHADCELESNALAEMLQSVAEKPAIVGGAFRYGILNAKSIVDWYLMNSGSINARLSGIYLGDHGIFCRKQIFHEIGGFPEVPIMYEFDFMKRLHKKGKVIQLKKRCYSSSRKFKQHGYLKIILLMRALRISHYFGLPASRLKNIYQSLSTKR